MAANYREAPNKNPGDSATLRQFIREIAASCTLSSTVAITIIDNFLKVALRLLSTEKPLREGGFGSFLVSVRKGAHEREGLPNFPQSSTKVTPYLGTRLFKNIQNQYYTIWFKRYSLLRH
jgi:nucleoid DNA-binding protein